MWGAPLWQQDAAWLCARQLVWDGISITRKADMRWWCSKGRQGREHLFKERTAWANEIRELWQRGRTLGKREEGRGRALRSRKGFGFRARLARAIPGNTSIRDLLSDGGSPGLPRSCTGGGDQGVGHL